MNQSKTPIMDGLKNYQKEISYRFHMPGHYGKLPEPYRAVAENLFAYDVTEVPGLDNLAEPEGMIGESLENLAAVYGAQKSYLLVNGSTSGVHIAIDALVPDGGKILIARNSHKSVHNIARRKNLEVEYIYPELDPIFGVDSHVELTEVARAVEEHGESDGNSTAEICSNRALQKEHAIAAVVLTYPNYYGRAYDLPAIYDYLRARNILLIVDSAHGASFEFSDELPISAVHCADVCVHSLHKTLPAFTQVSALHLGKHFPAEKIAAIEQSMRLYLSTSPSYLFLLSAELAVHIMDFEGRRRLSELKQHVDRLCQRLSRHMLIDVYESNLPSDFGKLLIRTPLDGAELSAYLRKEYRIQCEMTLGNTVLFMFGIVHEAQELDYLAEAICASAERLWEQKLDREATVDIAETTQVVRERERTVSGEAAPPKECSHSIEGESNWKKIRLTDGASNPLKGHPASVGFLPRLKKCTQKERALLADKKIVERDIRAAEGSIAAEDFVPYPPGIPVVLKYEVLEREALELMHLLGQRVVSVFCE